MKRFILFLALGLILLSSFAAYSEMEHKNKEGQQMMHHKATDSKDTRIQLNIPDMMKEHQKIMMREHLKAVNEIVGALVANDFELVSQTAHKKLGLTDEMRNMCSMFGNQDFEKIGLEFHTKADELGDVAKTKDLNKTLLALDTMLKRCNQCHSMFKQ